MTLLLHSQNLKRITWCCSTITCYRQSLEPLCCHWFSSRSCCLQLLIFLLREHRCEGKAVCRRYLKIIPMKRQNRITGDLKFNIKSITKTSCVSCDLYNVYLLSSSSVFIPIWIPLCASWQTPGFPSVWQECKTAFYPNIWLMCVTFLVSDEWNARSSSDGDGLKALWFASLLDWKHFLYEHICFAPRSVCYITEVI